MKKIVVIVMLVVVALSASGCLPDTHRELRHDIAALKDQLRSLQSQVQANHEQTVQLQSYLAYMAAVGERGAPEQPVTGAHVSAGFTITDLVVFLGIVAGGLVIWWARRPAR